MIWLRIIEGIMTESEKITIIEGPSPTFEADDDSVIFSLMEGPTPSQLAVCQLRTFNGPSLVERCYRAWKQHQIIKLEYRTEDGLTRQAPILAAHWSDLSDGDILTLWVRLDRDELNTALDFPFDDNSEEDDDRYDSQESI
jgi:hypothetical protein